MVLEGGELQPLSLILRGHKADSDLLEVAVAEIPVCGHFLVDAREELLFGHHAGIDGRLDLFHGEFRVRGVFHLEQNALRQHQKLSDPLGVRVLFETPDSLGVRLRIGGVHLRNVRVRHEHREDLERFGADGLRGGAVDAVLLEAHVENITGVVGQRQVAVCLQNQQQEDQQHCQIVPF